MNSKAVFAELTAPDFEMRRIFGGIKGTEDKAGWLAWNSILMGYSHKKFMRCCLRIGISRTMPVMTQ